MDMRNYNFMQSDDKEYDKDSLCEWQGNAHVYST